MEKCLQQYNLLGSKVTPMVGYDSTNFKVEDAGKKYVLKRYPAHGENLEMLLAENALLQFLSATHPNKFPTPICNMKGEEITLIKENNKVFAYRMLTFLEGTFLGEMELTPRVLESFGQFMAQLDLTLMPYRSLVLKGKQTSWDITHLHLSKKYLEYIPDPGDRKLVSYYMLQFKEEVEDQLPHLRHSLIHNDGNEWNVLADGEKIRGLIDFGDMVYAPLVNEVVVSLTYLMMGKDDPLSFVLPFLKHYHSLLPLEEKELSLLYYLIAARLCVSVCHSAYHKKQQPGNDYLVVSEKPAWELLRKWLTLSPVGMTRFFKMALGMDAGKNQPVGEVMARREKVISPALSVSYSTPLFFKKAAFQYMYDHQGKVYLDAYNNIPHVGHEHPKVVEAGQRQMARLNTNTRYLYPELAQYAERLLAKLPPSFKKVYFVNSGSAASDLAIRLAQAFTEKEKILVMEHGYHGNTTLGIDISPYKYKGKGGKGKKGNILEASLPDLYRMEGPFPETFSRETISQISSHQGQIATFIAESILGCAGQVPLPPHFLKEVYAAIRAQGGICVADEVQTGFGRVGESFWAFEQHGVIPDIVIMGKPMGNGHPLGAVATTDEIAEAFHSGMEFFSSFGGNPVSCSIGLSVLDVLEEEGLQANAQAVGAYFIQLLRELQSDFPVLGDIRGTGLFLGIEWIEDPSSKIQNTLLASQLNNGLKDRGILVSTDGPYNNVIKMKPPLCFSRQNALQVVEEMHSLLKALF